MAPTPQSQTVSVGGRTIKLTNLGKVLYPETQTTKADVIAYYAGVAEVMLPHLRERPATRKRWPDGVAVDGTSGSGGSGGSGGRSERGVFFNKDLGAGTPDWVTRHKIAHRDHDNFYPVVNDLATLTWLAQLAALELHVPQWRFGRNGQPRNPDRLVLDLDPGAGVSLAECAEVARWAREILTDIGHEPVPVTSGSKGIHLYAPLDGSINSDQATQVAEELARALEADHRDRVISSMRRSERDGKVFIDWSQNNGAKTTVAPYSLRGRHRPTVAAPRTWDELESTDLDQLDYHQVLERVASGLDPFSVIPAGPTGAGSTDVEQDKLATYRSMRDANRTPEPVPGPDASGPAEPGEDLTFVIQEHHARALHYDVRLERDSVLVSWAVPKGPPEDGGTNHLAVQTEDHPMEYATFAGDIPRGEYGGGGVSIWDSGTYRLHKWRDGKEVIATLFGRPGGGLGGVAKFALIHTGGGQGRAERNWLMHRMDTDPEDLDAVPPVATETELPAQVRAMRAGAGTVDQVRGDGWTYEMDWQGERVVAYLVASRVQLLDADGTDQTDRHPAVRDALLGWTTGVGPFPDDLMRDGVVLDGIVVAGTHLFVLDLLRLGRRSMLREPYTARRQTLEELLPEVAGATVQVPPAFAGDLAAALQAAADLGLTGVVAKRSTSTYQPGRTARTWLRVTV